MNTGDILTALIALSSIITIICLLWYNTKSININTEALNINAKTMGADFIYRLRNDFYSKKNKLIMFFIENDFIDFKENKEKGKEYESYFAIKKDKVDSLPENFSVYIEFAKNSFYTIHIQEMDDFVLGYLEDIGEFYARKIFDIKYISNAFGYYIIKVFENKAMKEYIKWDRTGTDKICHNDYSLFEKLAKEIQNI